MAIMVHVVRRKPTPRGRVYETYWTFACERQRIFERRVKGTDAPWTTDPILAEFKFCNVFRAADRVSQYLIRDVAYDEQQTSPEERLFQVVAFRVFSRIATWRAVREYLGRQPSLEDLRSNAFQGALEHARKSQGRLYTGAFILCATDAYGKLRKYLNHVELFRDMFIRCRLGSRLLEARSLQAIYELLHCFPLMGDFMSYQLAIDINYTTFVDFSENDFARAGPGALRGVKKVFRDLGDYSPDDVIRWMVDRQEQEFDRLDLPFDGLWGRALHAIDCQGLFCETDKYCREAIPELKSARKRIKARFSPTAEPLQLFFPPKWGLNSRLPLAPVLGDANAKPCLTIAGP